MKPLSSLGQQPAKWGCELQSCRWPVAVSDGEKAVCDMDVDGGEGAPGSGQHTHALLHTVEIPCPLARSGDGGRNPRVP